MVVGKLSVCTTVVEWSVFRIWERFSVSYMHIVSSIVLQHTSFRNCSLSWLCIWGLKTIILQNISNYLFQVWVTTTISDSKLHEPCMVWSNFFSLGMPCCVTVRYLRRFPDDLRISGLHAGPRATRLLVFTAVSLMAAEELPQFSAEVGRGLLASWLRPIAWHGNEHHFELFVF